MKGCWQIRVVVNDPSLLSDLEDCLADLTLAVSTFREEASELWHLSGYSETQPDSEAVEKAFADVAACTGADTPEIICQWLDARDWVRESRLPALEVGRFQIIDTADNPRQGLVPVQIDAGLAFGTGRHESTEGCLLAFSRLYPGEQGRHSRLISEPAAESSPLPLQRDSVRE